MARTSKSQKKKNPSPFVFRFFKIMLGDGYSDVLVSHCFSFLLYPCIIYHVLHVYNYNFLYDNFPNNH